MLLLRLVPTDARRRPIAYHGVVAVEASARPGIRPGMGGVAMQIQVRDALHDLTSDEIREAVRVLRAERGLAETVRFDRPPFVPRQNSTPIPRKIRSAWLRHQARRHYKGLEVTDDRSSR